MRIDKRRAVTLVIDIQERLLPAMEDYETIEKNARILIEGSQVLGLPILYSEQYPKGLGPTVESLRPWINDNLHEKTSFSLMDDMKDVMEALFSQGRDQFIISGIETHVCVYQTARDLLELDKEVYLASDAMGSRKLENKNWALQSLLAMGARILPTETILFDIQRSASTDTFKKISSLIK
ncbi:MAG: isochorismatase family protein [Tissierellia bacterium]|nr:isochorismatase family protein [Tissierellia bacterium]